MLLTILYTLLEYFLSNFANIFDELFQSFTSSSCTMSKQSILKQTIPNEKTSHFSKFNVLLPIYADSYNSSGAVKYSDLLMSNFVGSIWSTEFCLNANDWLNPPIFHYLLSYWSSSFATNKIFVVFIFKWAILHFSYKKIKAQSNFSKNIRNSSSE